MDINYSSFTTALTVSIQPFLTMCKLHSEEVFVTVMELKPLCRAAESKRLDSLARICEHVAVVRRCYRTPVWFEDSPIQMQMLSSGSLSV